jgi:hypothetical protein
LLGTPWNLRQAAEQSGIKMVYCFQFCLIRRCTHLGIAFPATIRSKTSPSCI